MHQKRHSSEQYTLNRTFIRAIKSTFSSKNNIKSAKKQFWWNIPMFWLRRKSWSVLTEYNFLQRLFFRFIPGSPLLLNLEELLAISWAFHLSVSGMELVVGDTQSDSIQCLNFAEKWIIQYLIQYCFTQDSNQNIIQFKIHSSNSIQ